MDEIVKGRATKQVKAISLIKLGLMPHEVNLLLGTTGTVKRAKGFNANNLTFGVEIECYNVTRDAIIREVARRSISIQSERYNHDDNERYYKIVSDASISGDEGQEVVSPILKGKKGADSLKAVCEALGEAGARVNRSTGLHVHFDARGISDAHYINIFVNYQRLEEVIDSFMPQSRRGDGNVYCHSIRDVDYSRCDRKEDVSDMSLTRYRKVNAQSYRTHGTIEFRQHSGTTEYDKIRAWLDFLRALISYSFDNTIEDCHRIEDVPFLTETQKRYFINRREALR